MSLDPKQFALVNGRVWRAGICVWTRDTEVNALVPPMTLYTVVLRRGHFLKLATETVGSEISAQLQECPKICNDKALAELVARALRRSVDSAGRLIATKPTVEYAAQMVQDEVLGYLIPVIVEVLSRDFPRKDSFKSQSKTVRAARQYALQDLSRPVRIEELCDHVRVCRRQLQSSFTDVVGIGPVAYMRALRLSFVRTALLRGESATVQACAERYGFRHPGRFSQEYRHMFGEQPSNTLAGTAGT